MNKNTAKDYLPLVQALSEGKVIQYRYQKSDKSYDWMSLGPEVDFSMHADCYRIKPEPREIWVNRRNDGLNGHTAFASEAEATDGIMSNWTAIRYREVLE